MNTQKFYDVDYQSVKNRLRLFLSKQTLLKDYNFEGSAISMWMHFIAYSIVYINTILNFFAGEMFIDSARIDENIYKHAYQKNYLPKRKYAPSMKVNITNNHTSPITINVGTNFLMNDIPLTNISELIIAAGDTVETVLYEGEHKLIAHMYEGKDFETIRLPDREDVSQNYFSVAVAGQVWNSVYDDQNFLNANVYYIRYLRNFDIVFDNADGVFSTPTAGDMISVMYIKTHGATFNGLTSASAIDIDHASSALLEIYADGVLKNGKDEESFKSIATRAIINNAVTGRIITEKDYRFKIKDTPVANNFYDMTIYSSHRDYVTKADHIPVKEYSTDHKRDVGFYVYTAIKRELVDNIPVYETTLMTDGYNPTEAGDNEYLSIINYLEHYRHIQTFPKFKSPSILQLKPNIRVKLMGGFNIDKIEFEDEIFDYLENEHVGFNQTLNKSDLVSFLKRRDFVDYVDMTITGVIQTLQPTHLFKVDSIDGFELYEEVKNNADTFAGKIIEIWEEKSTIVIRRTSNTEPATISDLIGQESSATCDVTSVYRERVIRLQKAIKPSTLVGEISGVPITDNGSGDIHYLGDVVGSVDYDLGYITIDNKILDYDNHTLFLNVEFVDDISFEAKRELFLDYYRSEVEYL